MRQQMGNDSGFGCCRIINVGIVLILILIIISDAIQGKSPQNGTERVSVTSAKTFFFSLKDWEKMKSE